MKKQNVVLAVIIIVGILASYGSYWLKRNLQVFPVGGRTQEKAIEITPKEKIEIDILIEKNERWCPMIAYWDEKKDEAQYIEQGLFKATGEIEAPETSGLHKLTIETGWGIKIKYNYYYIVNVKS